ncbi:MAG: Rrf2 family transcriptional regulator [Nitrospinota bacterium]|nr:Rrf2 family transcriptional regulator [Nitrospinota bacterium]
MKLLNKDSDYAIRALLSLGLNIEERMSSRDIAEAQGIPLQYMRRILQTLVREGYLESKEGVGGGLRLIVNPADIAISDVIKVFQGEIRVSECLFRQNVCPQYGTCVLRRRLAKIETKVAKEFEGITVENLLSDLKEEEE